MSGNIIHNYHFLHLLVSTDVKQQVVLLQNLNNEQTNLLTEIFHNLGHNIKFEENQHKTFKKYLNTIELLSQVDKTWKQRNRIIRKNIKKIIAILNIVGQDLLKVGDHFNTKM